jgi:hypothetical protein
MANAEWGETSGGSGRPTEKRVAIATGNCFISWETRRLSSVHHCRKLLCKHMTVKSHRCCCCVGALFYLFIWPFPG